MTQDWQNHSKHSALVRYWKPKNGKALPFGEMPPEGTCHKLRSPYEGYLVEVRFSEVPSMPDVMFVRSTNWRAEHEPHGMWPKQECRKFYTQLKRAGFVKPKEGE